MLSGPARLSCFNEGDEHDKFDMTSLYRSTIGFDRLANIFDALGATDNSSAYPPHNVARTGETDYRISMAVAGFAEDELEIIELGGVLRVRGGATGDGPDGDTQLLYRGIAKRNFERSFQLADNVQVSGAHLIMACCTLNWCAKCPKRKKPRKINISKNRSSRVTIGLRSSAGAGYLPRSGICI